MTFADASKYHGLLMHELTRTLLHYEPNKFKACCNGVGSKVGNWFDRALYHITPNTIWFLNIKIVADIHDVEYTYPKIFFCKEDAIKWKNESDNRFLDNLYIHIKRQNSWKWVEKLRLSRADKYYYLLENFGEKAFLENKEF